MNPAEVKPSVTEAPPMVDHDVVLQTGSIPRCASPVATQQALRVATNCTPHLHVCRGTHYQMLGVARDADEVEVKKAFYRLAQKWHPDKNPEHIAEAETVFKAVKLSYDVLADAAKRRKYDAKLQMGAHLKAAYA